MPNPAVRAVFWDFGGVITESPFEAFERYERERGLPPGFIRRLNAANPDRNAWARLERGEITLAEFDCAFAEEAHAAGQALSGSEVVGLLYGAVRPAMVQALRRCGEHYLTACLTNNINTGVGHGLPTSDARAAEVERILQLFDLVIESSKTGVRKPEPAFYRMALDALKIEAPQAVYLDDLGMNLKPARAMGMTTIKVDSPAQALAELEQVLGLSLRDE
ncbi:MAG TPA: HAD-IA family hydrolase [Burkholderiales bacterium]|nr:HAD-IA family hydrolase [Burkholderiales bacterium]